MFDLILADPPWHYDDKNLNRGGAARHYETMKLHELKAIDVANWANKDSILMMWTTGPHLISSIELMEAWGFKYRTLGFVWVKRSKNHWSNCALRLRRMVRSLCAGKKVVPVRDVLSMINELAVMGASKDFWHWGQGHYTRSNAEIVLIGVRGRGVARLDKGIHQVLESLVGEHSAKPDEAYDRLERLYGEGICKLDMFTRRNRAGWYALGDQVDQTDFYIEPETSCIVRYDNANDD